MSNSQAHPKRKASDQSSGTINKSSPKRQKNADSHAPRPHTTASDSNSRRRNLTLAEWLRVFEWHDQHPTATQTEIVRHFATSKSGPLFFTQPTLSRKLEERTKMEARVNDHPTALSSKRPRVVRAPEVEQALVLWAQQMKHDGETITGPMLQKERERFEEELCVPNEKRLSGVGWIPSFCKTYNIWEHRRHGEAASDDMDVVEVERERCEAILAQYAARTLGPADEQTEEDQAKSDGSAAEIAEQVCQEVLEADREVIEVDDENDVDEVSITPSRTDLIKMCRQLEVASIRYGDPSFALSLAQQLRKFRAILRRDELPVQNSKQTTLDNYFS